MATAPNVTLDRKLACLSRPDSYGGGTRAVETIETHRSYVFLTRDYAYKMKKPERELATLAARRANCEEEVRLNRRLAAAAYLGVVPLALADGGLTIEGAGEPVEWLVKMRRLPRHLMLDAAIRERRLDDTDILRIAAALAAFYLATDRAPLGAAEYAARLRAGIDGNREALRPAHYELDAALLERVASAQLERLDALGSAVARRAALLVEGHGDLRPEHVCLEDPPLFIDCLEFDRELRITDPVDEIGYLAMECACMGEPAIGSRIVKAYRLASGDDADDALVRFYQSCRASTRAKLAAWHLDDAVVNGGRNKWIAQARRYLDLAASLVFSLPAAPGPNRLRACA